MQSTDTIAVFCSDLHLSHYPPAWRSNEPDWYGTMYGVLDEVNDIAVDHNGSPIFFAGDLFDHWGKPGDKQITAKLMDFAFKNVEGWHCIPGQHDLPEHNPNQQALISAYDMLARSEAINDIGLDSIERTVYPVSYTRPFTIAVSAFRYGTMVKPLAVTKRADIEIALAHDYVWHKTTKFCGGTDIKHYGSVVGNRLLGYDVIVFGDNHAGFQTTVGDTVVYNCGTLMRRRSNEQCLRPHVGLLRADGRIAEVDLDVSTDVYLSPKEEEEIENKTVEFEALQSKLFKLGQSALDFTETVERICRIEGTEREVKQLIIDSMHTTGKD